MITKKKFPNDKTLNNSVSMKQENEILRFQVGQVPSSRKKALYCRTRIMQKLARGLMGGLNKLYMRLKHF